ncbi:hypothetical protein [Pseudoponticoccus marisrubri]|uniref:Peptidase M48 domain-containing protein n=1 Tax=Pseudoponticoccus marisrubri TaxID=1685382 RepID=A0A0W7WGG8_9RHOB|nr:hypothetical protein [Pseudoponticoccus marisrubri]KUF09697.1 hypothetical protein AVJ23_16210 [Pseudoponticoccus marisrubri]
MTALKQFDRLEATGLWRRSPDEQRREVIVSLGDATLTMSDINGTALAHWSLGAVNRANGTAVPAIYFPDNDPGETLELGADETEMINGIDRLLRAIERRRPHPGKLRFVLSGMAALALGVAAVVWFPDALQRYTVSVVPPLKRAEIGGALLQSVQRVTGPPCMTEEARRPLRRLAMRVLGEGAAGRVVIVPDGPQTSAHLPGGLILLNRSVVEDHEDPDVAAGHILVEAQRAAVTDPLADLIAHAGLMASLRLLTTGNLPDSALSDYAEHLVTASPVAVGDETLLAAFAAAELRSSPYAYAQDITGETMLPLIEADPRAEEGSRPVLSDADWVRLQGICGA